jgi:hypothetical protein
MVQNDLLKVTTFGNRHELHESKLRGVQIVTELVLAEVGYGALEMASRTGLFDLQELLGVKKIDKKSYGKEREKKHENVSLLHYFRIVKQSLK